MVQGWSRVGSNRAQNQRSRGRFSRGRSRCPFRTKVADGAGAGRQGRCPLHTELRVFDTPLAEPLEPRRATWQHPGFAARVRRQQTGRRDAMSLRPVRPCGFVKRAVLDRLPAPTMVGRTRTGGIDMNSPRIRAALAP